MLNYLLVICVIDEKYLEVILVYLILYNFWEVWMVVLLLLDYGSFFKKKFFV